MAEDVTRLGLAFFAKTKEEGQPLMGWPLYDFDPEIKINKMKYEAEEWSRKLNNKVQFVVKKWVQTEKDIEEFKRHDLDGLVVYILTTSVNYPLLFKMIDELNKPTVIGTEPYHSLAWPEISSLMKEGKPVVGVSSSNREDLLRAIRALHAYAQLKKSKVLVVSVPNEMSLETLHQSGIYAGDRAYNENYFKKIKGLLRLEFADYRELLKTMETIPTEEAHKIAEKLKEGAYWIREGITDEHLVLAGKMYLAAKKMIKEKGATAFTINCLTALLLDPNALPVTPCSVLSLLNDEGIPAACEADLNSMIMQILFKHLAERPAWIVDPVIDFNGNYVIHAHCTAPTKMKGYNREAEPYALDTHDESGKPLTVRTKMTIGTEITVAQISSDFTKLVMHTSKIEDTPIIEIACRTKITTRVPNAKEYLWNYESPLHRVVVYGDWTEELTYLSKFLGLDVYREA